MDERPALSVQDTRHQPHCFPLAHDYINNCAICYDTTEHGNFDPDCVTCRNAVRVPNVITHAGPADAHTHPDTDE